MNDRLKQTKARLAKKALLDAKTQHLPAGSGVYKITNTVTGECYVGGTQAIRQRCRMHLGKLLDGNHYNAFLQESHRLHGDATLEFSVIEECPVDEVWRVELRWFKTLKPAFNINPPAGVQTRFGRTTVGAK